MVKMNKTNLIVPFIAVLTLLLVNFAAASINVEFDGITLVENTNIVAGMVGDTVPVVVEFTLDNTNANASNVELIVEMYGFRNDVSARVDISDLEDGVTYTRKLSLSLPDDTDVLSEDYTLNVRLVNRTGRIEDKSYDVRLQRVSHTLEILSVDFDTSVSSSETVPVTVVVRNSGYNVEDDVYVTVSIPALGVSQRTYLGDLVPVENCNNGCDQEDVESKVVYVKIPSDAETGVYDVRVRAYSDDAEATETSSIRVGGSVDSNFFPAATSKTLRAGETVSYDLVIVNTADNVKSYSLQAVSGDDLTITVPSIVVVGPRDSAVVTVEVTAANDAYGDYTFSVISDSKQVVYTASISGSSMSGAIVALTVALVIIFLVLLVVLIVLATRKGSKEVEEVETSYY